MVRINKKSRVGLSLLLTIMMVLGSFTSLVYAQNDISKVEVSKAKDELRESSLQKIEKEVLGDLEREEYAEVLVYMTEQTDTQMIAEATKKAVSSSFTPYKTKMVIRRGVIESLKDTAEKTQVDILKYLEQEKEKGNVLEYEPYYIVNIIYLKATKEVVENIACFGEVERVYKNKFHEIEEPIKNDINKESIGEEDIEWNIEKIGADLAWDMGIDGRGVVVGLIDSGATWDHPALKEKWRGYDVSTGTINSECNWFDAISGDSMPYDIPESPHGSHVLGTILGQEPDGSNKIGVAPGAKWIAAKAFTADGGQDRWLISAGEWMLAPGGDETKAPDIINNSWGGQAGIDDWYRDIVKNWRAAGIFPVFAAGNQKRGEPEPWPGSIQNPSNYPESFAVAATDKNNIRGSFSKLGPSPYDETMIKPNISAPGVNIRSSVPGGYEGGWNGTSMATPHIAGTAALLLSADSSLTVDQIEHIIENTAIPLTDSTYTKSPNFGYGHGLINAFDAVSTTITGRGTIKGKVLADGEDLENPKIYHEQEITEAYYGSRIGITANINDDISILESELLVKTQGKSYWNVIPMDKISGDHKSGVYKGEITPDILEEPGLVYKIRVMDYANNVVVSEDYKIDVKFGITPDDYEMDFERFPVAWLHDGDWEWGEPVEEIGPKPHSGTKLIGTVLDEKYSNNSDSTLITPPIDLRDSTLEAATFRFYHWYETEMNRDNGRIYVSNDYGEKWKQVGPVYTGEQKEWKEVVINLEEYIGSETPVYIAYYFTSDASRNMDGWYIDSVRLVEIDREVPTAPVGLGAQPMMKGIQLNWDPSPDADLAGYKIYRKSATEKEYSLIEYTTDNLYFDTEVESGKAYYYSITAVDFSKNESEYSEEVFVTALTVTNLYSSSFENDNGGFIAGGNNNTWEWGEPISGPKEAFSGTKVWATSLSGNYLSNSNCWVESPEIVIPEDKNPVLVLTHWIDTENIRYDYGQVSVSNDNGESWHNVTPGEKFGGHIKEWENTEISLDEYSGETIKIRFNLVSDFMSNYNGWYIDNVSVMGVEKNISTKSTGPIIGKGNVLEQKQKHRFLEDDYVELRDFNYRINVSETNNYDSTEDSEIHQNISGIPVDASITILETGRSVRTNPSTGEYEIAHAANEKDKNWTLYVDAYGYYPQEVKVHVKDEEIVKQDFNLEEIPKGNIVGQVIDRHSKVPAANVVVKVKEDSRVESVVTDEEGRFVIEGVYEGEYTLKFMADEFEPDEAKINVIGKQDNEIKVPLKRFIGYEEEISYDDGTAETALALSDKGNGLAVKVTPNGYGKIKATNIYFWGSNFPSPGGNEIGLAIFDTDDKGNPSKIIGEPKVVNINRGEWNLIDLSEYGFATDRDFFIATIQTKVSNQSPGVGIDESNFEPERSYLHIGGEEFVPIAGEGVKGGLMIRAIMEYAVNTPDIISLEDINHINQDKISIFGVTNVDGKVNIYVNDEKVMDTEVKNREFAADVDLIADKNIITVTAELDGIETEPSKSKVVIKDKVDPILNVIKPIDEQNINTEVIHVTGSVFDEYLDKVLINDMEVEIDENGQFYERLLVDEGENVIIIKAIDLAGNVSTVERKVYVKFSSSIIEDIQPVEDIILEAGDVFTVRFRSDIGGEGYFRIASGIDVLGTRNSKISMIELEDTPGIYEGRWTIPERFTINNGLVEVEFIDSSGNKSVAIAPGRVTILETDEPVDLTDEEPMENLPSNTVIVGNEAFDIRYLNNDEGAQLKLINWYSQGKEIYIKLSKDSIVNIRGEIVEIDVLPNELTYYDADGRITRYMK